jgi:dinuclear metal center YbgI/SA1388 family protein
MTFNRDDIISFCNKTLDLHSYPDYGPMGAQFLGAEEVTTVACAVSVSAAVIKEAADLGAQMLIVHHGMFWNNESRLIDKRHEQRLQALNDNKITLLSYHLALDAHPTLGNNILAANLLGVTEPEDFGEIGFGGSIPLAPDVYTIRHKVALEYNTTPTLYQYGSREIKRACAITGGAAHYIQQAYDEGYDLFFTGEADEQSIYLAADLGINFMAAGHDKTERAGVKALTKVVADKFNLKTAFLRVENPV